jgi:large subunit ribosomal protein L15
MQIHQLKREHPNTRARRVGRGGKRGKTSGRGGKGQTARAGAKVRPAIRDVIKKLPKLRGYRFKSFRPKPLIVNVSVLNQKFGAGEVVSPKTLIEKGIIDMPAGRECAIKILGDGVLTKKLAIEGCFVSGSAREKITAAGGSIA